MLAHLDPDWRVRLAAFDRLTELTRHTGGVVSSDELTRGFEFEGERIHTPRREIYKPNRDYLAERYERFRAA